MANQSAGCFDVSRLARIQELALTLLNGKRLSVPDPYCFRLLVSSSLRAFKKTVANAAHAQAGNAEIHSCAGFSRAVALPIKALQIKLRHREAARPRCRKLPPDLAVSAFQGKVLKHGLIGLADKHSRHSSNSAWVRKPGRAQLKA